MSGNPNTPHDTSHNKLSPLEEQIIAALRNSNIVLPYQIPASNTTNIGIAILPDDGNNKEDNLDKVFANPTINIYIVNVNANNNSGNTYTDSPGSGNYFNESPNAKVEVKQEAVPSEPTASSADSECKKKLV